MLLHWKKCVRRLQYGEDVMHPVSMTRVSGAYEVRQKYLKDNSNTLSLYTLYEWYNCWMWIRIRNATDHNILNWLIYSSRNWGMIESNVAIINFYKEEKNKRWFKVLGHRFYVKVRFIYWNVISIIQNKICSII